MNKTLKIFTGTITGILFGTAMWLLLYKGKVVFPLIAFSFAGIYFFTRDRKYSETTFKDMISKLILSILFGFIILIILYIVGFILCFGSSSSSSCEFIF